MKLTTVFAYPRNYSIKAQVAPIALATVMTRVSSPPKKAGGIGGKLKEQHRTLKLYYTPGTNSIPVGKQFQNA
jgi:hypothetical protein